MKGKKPQFVRGHERIALSPAPFPQNFIEAGGRSDGTRQGESKIVHFRQLFGEAPGRLFSPDTEGKKRDLVRSPGHEPQGGSSTSFLYLRGNVRTTMISESQISSTFVTPTRSPVLTNGVRSIPLNNCLKVPLKNDKTGLIRYSLSGMVPN